MSAYRIPFCWGNTKDRDHAHYFIYNNLISGGDNVNPFTLDNVMSLLWRVKTFHVVASALSVSGTVTRTSDMTVWSFGPTAYPFTLPNFFLKRKSGHTPSNDPTTFVLTTDEQHLFDGFYTHGGTDYTINAPTHDRGFYTDPYDGDFVYISTNEDPTSVPHGTIRWDATLKELWTVGVLPLNFTATPWVSLINDGSGRGVTVTASVGGSDGGSSSFVMNGCSLTSELRGGGSPDIGYTVDTLDFTGAIDCTASEYFPFNDSTGMPIYDTSTGALLNDPFG